MRVPRIGRSAQWWPRFVPCIGEQAKMPWLKMIKGESPGTVIPLYRDVTVLGSDSSCDLPLCDQGVSRRHARIVRKDDGFCIEDLQSSRGTRVGDPDLTDLHRLSEGDLVEVGNTQFVYSESDGTLLGVVDSSSGDGQEAVRVRPPEGLEGVGEITEARRRPYRPRGVAETRPARG